MAATAFVDGRRLAEVDEQILGLADEQHENGCDVGVRVMFADS